MPPVVGQPRQDVLGAGGGLGLQFGQQLLPKVVVLEVVGGNGAHAGGQSEHPARGLGDGRVVLLPLEGLAYQRYRVLAVVEVAHAPAAVIEADHDRIEPRRIEVGGASQILGEVDRSLAERDGGDLGEAGEGFGDDVDGVGVVEDVRSGTDGADVVDDPLHGGDGAQGHEEAPWALGLLADDAVLKGDALVEVARLEATGSEAGQHRVGFR